MQRGEAEMEKRDFADMVIFFCQNVSEMNISQKHKMELLGMITAIEIKHDELMPKWTPVTEALPDTNNDVLLQFKSNMAVGYYEDDGWSIATGEDLYCGIDESEDKPIAWMPLPEPWKGE
jgi:hypothetical protein